MKKNRIFHINPVLCLAGIFLTFFLSLAVYSEGVRNVSVYEIPDTKEPVNKIDEYVTAKLKENNITPANLCSDAVFIRRVYIDVIGTLPEPNDVKDFLDDRSPDKRKKLIDSLLKRPEYAEYWAQKWGDILRIKAEFPINLWPNAVQAYHRWVRDSIRDNKPYDVFARELLTSSGSNFRVPPVNFYRATQNRDAAGLASAAALTFMGTRLDKWSEKERNNLAVFFSRISYKKTDEWKEEIVCVNQATTTTLEAFLPDGTKVSIPPGGDPRLMFADWLISPDNPWFARNIVNRTWAWLMGRGIINEADDIRTDNPPVNPELLRYLEKELVKANYDLKHIYTLILNSHTYQQSSLPAEKNKYSEELFAYYPARRMDAETLQDAINQLSGTGEVYSSAIPEPFTFVPDYERTISLADGSITNQFLETFGRPGRDTGLLSERNNEPTEGQRMYLLNSNELQEKIGKSKMLRRAFEENKKNPKGIIRMFYLNILSRYPTEEEISTTLKYITSNKNNVKEGAEDLAWALINSKEFLYRH